MTYSSPEIKAFLGVYSQENTFTVPDGALEVASNVVVSRNNVVTKRRGFYQYYDPGSDTANNLLLYQSRLLGVFSDKIGYFTDTGSAPNLTGTRTVNGGATVAVTGSRVSRSMQSNNNLYFTTDNGVLKLESYSSSAYRSGTPPALDIRARTVTGGSGILDSDTQVAWRALFGRRDSNDNLILGAPSDIVSLTNAEQVGKSYSNPSGNLVEIVNTSHGLTVGTVITISASSDSGLVGGTYAISAVVDANTFRFDKGSAVSPASGTLTYVASYKPRLEFSVPSEITTTADGYFFQVYRTSKSISSAVSPDANFKLVDEIKLSSAEITAGLVVYDDEIDDVLLGAELYTNPNSREGELQANGRAPLCDDVALFKNHALYAKCTTRHILDLAVIDSTAIASGDYVEIKVDATTRRYVARTGVGNSTVTAVASNVGTTVTVTYASHGLVAGDTIYVTSAVATTNAPAGAYTVATAAAGSFTFTAASVPTGLTSLDVEGVTNGTYPIFKLDNASGSVSLRLRETAQGLVRAVNRDDSSLVYANYVSGITDTPGKMRFQAKGFTGKIYIRASTATVGASFTPILPDSFASGDQVFSRNDDQPHILYSSKIGEPEAVPLVNFFAVGARNKKILRIVALRDSVIVLKEDGVFRLNGDNVSNFTVTALDTTILTLDASSVVLLNNQVLALSNQGVCLITDSAVQIVSRRIEDLISPILGQTLMGQTGAVAYESERLYLLSTLSPNETTNTTVHAFNVLNESWVSWDTMFKQATIGPSDTLFTITTSGKINKERKNQTRIDYCAQNYAVTVVSASGSGAVVSSSTHIPEIGEVIVKNDVFNRIKSVSGVNPYTLTFYRQTNLAASDAVTLYAKYDSTVKLAPFHAGLVGRSKQFAQMQIHTRDESITTLDITFTGNTFGGSELVTWEATAVGSASAGWGAGAWGFFPWGDSDGVNITQGTRNAPIIRIYVPLFQQRNTFIQPLLVHKNAGEALNIQAISFSVRPYAERVTR